jgi:hypothetical protein
MTVEGLTEDELAQLLRDAEQAHAEYERTTGERDEDWPRWYARWLLERLRGRGDRV